MESNAQELRAHLWPAHPSASASGQVPFCVAVRGRAGVGGVPPWLGQTGMPLLGRVPPPPCPLRTLVTAHGPFTGTCPTAGAQWACDGALGSSRGCGRWA